MNLPDLKLRVPAEKIAALGTVLRKNGYTEDSVKEILGVWDLSQLNGAELPRYVWQCQENGSDLAKLVKFFLLGENLTNREAPQLLGRKLVNDLLFCDLVFRDGADLFCNCVIYPCDEVFIVTDYWVTGTGHKEGQVYELGTDSFVLTRITPREKEWKTLDLCTGSGVHAVMSALACRSSVAVDINPRALEYTAFNAALNSVECETHLGDLYSAAPEGPFDLITANPPYVPTPDPTMAVHRGVGETGEEVPERLVAGLPERLAEGGLFSMVLEYPIYENSDYLDRLESWLGENEGWKIVVLSFGAKDVGNYIKQHIANSPNYEEKFRSYLQSYQEQGIVGIDFANVFIMRCGAGEPNWKHQTLSAWPQVCKKESIAEWLETLRRYSSQNWKPEPDWKPELHSRYRTVWQNRERTSGFLEAVEPQWLPPQPLSAAETQLIWDISGEATVAELQAKWLDQGRDEESFLETLRGLGLQQAFA